MTVSCVGDIEIRGLVTTRQDVVSDVATLSTSLYSIIQNKDIRAAARHPQGGEV